MVKFTWGSVGSDLMAPSPAVVGKEVERGVLFWLFPALQVHPHAGIVDGVVVLRHLCGCVREGVRRVLVESLCCNFG